MSLDEIAQKLKSARDTSGLSLAQIQEKTKIPYAHLASIDAGNFDDLPEPVYVSGFIRRYAECVGLDAQELVDVYRNELNAVPVQTKGRGIFKGQKTNGNNMPSQGHPYNRQRIEKAAPNLFKLVPFYALWIVLILVLIIYLVNRQGEIEQNQQDAGLLTLKQSTANLSATKVTPANTPENVQRSETTSENNSESASQIADDKNRVTLKAKNHVWVEVKAVSSGESLFNGFLEAGDTHDFSDKEGLRIRAGNAGNVLITASGKTAELGQAGKIAEKIFSSNKVSQVTENQATDNNGQVPPHKNTSSLAAGQNTNDIKKPETSIAKKTIGEAAIAKKSSASNSPLKTTRSSKQNLSAHEADSSNTYNDQNPSNKSIDVPYRYSE